MAQFMQTADMIKWLQAAEQANPGLPFLVFFPMEMGDGSSAALGEVQTPFKIMELQPQEGRPFRVHAARIQFLAEHPLIDQTQPPHKLR